MHQLTLLSIIVVAILAGCGNKHYDAPPSNVLLIIVDDLRPELNCYGNRLIHSPNIDRLAKEGVLFKNAYCNVPVCGASRASFLTGLRPTRNRFLTYMTYAREDAAGYVPIPRYFKDNGYTTVSNGKVFHNQDDHESAWDVNWRPYSDGGPFDYQTVENRNPPEGKRGRAYEWVDTHDSVYNDGKIAAKSISDLRKLKEEGKPFFMAVGFLKPHLPFNAPKKYWDLYEGKVKLPDNNYVPKNAPAQSLHGWEEMRHYNGIPEKGPVSDSLAKVLIQGYYACVSYADAQVGEILDELARLGLDKNTHVVLIGDHGYNLQEHTLWCKHCNYRTSLRSAMIVKSPQAKAGSESGRFVEFVDIFPTLVELTGLQPLNHLQGKSLVKELSDPDPQGRGFAISKFTKGMTITTPQYAYTEWLGDNLSTEAEMLYDHRSDPAENENIVVKAEYRATADSLKKLLRDNWGEEF